MRQQIWFFAWFLGIVLAAGCSSNGTAADAAVADATGSADGSGADAGMCAGKLLFTGEYVDWDSTTSSFQGVFDAMVTEVGNPTNKITTPPNGRVLLCLEDDARSVVTLTQSDYLPVRYTVEPEAVQGAFSIRGLTLTRADELFATELALTRDPAAAQVMIAVRSYPGGNPVLGASVAIGNESFGAYTANADGTYGPGNTLISDAFVLFANVDTTGGKTTVMVTPPDGMTCTGPDSIDVVSGELAVTTFACSP